MISRNSQCGLVLLFAISFYCLISKVGLIYAQDPLEGKAEAAPAFYDQNETCLRCHGNIKYTYINADNGKEVTALMCDNRLVNRDDFYAANHKNLACTDCHSAEYDSFPHPGRLRMEYIYNCTDCHGFDQQYANYHFADIEMEFKQSIHYTANVDAFTCWKCHNPHTYKSTYRNSENIRESVAYDNHICLNCHSDFDQFQLLTSRNEIDIIQEHDWLPKQRLHFSQVRCIECHTRPNDSLLVAHMVVPKDNAVKRCVECHSENSLLVSSLYKYQAKENRTRAGFLNASILNEAFVIGANRNVFLNKVSIIFFFITIGLILIHLVLRMKFKKG
jgi:hypothetical protein